MQNIYGLNDADVRFLKRLRLREAGDARNDVPVTQYRPRAIVPKDFRTGTVYSGISIGTATSAAVGEVIFDSLDDTQKSFGIEDDEPTEVLNYLAREYQPGDRVLCFLDRTAHETTAGQVDVKPKNVWVVVGASTITTPRYGFGLLAPSGTALSSSSPINGLKLLESVGFQQADVNPGDPVTDFIEGSTLGWYDRIVAKVTGIWTVGFSALFRIATSQTATSPGDYTHKKARVISDGTAIGVGNDIGETSNLCLNELLITRTFRVLINANMADPHRVNHAFASCKVWNKWECSELTYYDYNITFPVELDAGDELSIWYDHDERYGEPAGDVEFATELNLHYNSEPL